MNPSLQPHAHLRLGFTLVEAVAAVSLLAVTLTASVSSLVYVIHNERTISAQGELDMDASLLVERLRRDLWRTSRDVILVYPPGDGPYQAISFPIVRGNEPVLLDPDTGQIEWNATVVYHLRNGDPSEVRRTVFTPRADLTEEEREQQLEDVATDGDGANTYNSANAHTSVLIENPVEWELNVNGIRFDTYAPDAGRRTFNLGTAMMEDGDNRVAFRAAGKNPDNDTDDQILGVDTLTVSASGLPREGEWQTVSATAGAVPAVTNMGPGEIWSGNSLLEFPATGDGDSFTLTMENDRWEERNFLAGGASFSNLVRTFSTAIDPNTFVLGLEGNGVVWSATNQTQSSLAGDTAMNDLSNVAIRVFVRGNDLVGSEGFDGGWIAFTGTNVWARFARGAWGMHIDKAFIAQSAIMLNPANNPMNIVPGTQKTFLFTNSVQKDLHTGLASPYESDKLDFLIEKTNSYVVGLVLSKNVYGNMRPSVFQDSTNTVGPNCALIVNPTADEAAEDADWSALPSQSLADSCWTDWTTAPTGTVLESSKIVGLSSLRAGYAPEGVYVSQIIDTQLADPDYLAFDWVATTPANSSLSLKVRAGASNDLSDADAWTDVPSATSGLAPVINGRFAQVWARFTPGVNSITTPSLRDFTLRWSGGRRYADLSGTFATGPDHGIYEVLVNDALLLQGVTVKVSVFKEVRTASGRKTNMVSSAFAEIVPRN